MEIKELKLEVSYFERFHINRTIGYIVVGYFGGSMVHLDRF